MSNNVGSFNTATGQGALSSNTRGTNNTADGQNALKNNQTGSNNIALGSEAGSNITGGSNNIEIGNRGSADDANTIRIGTEGTQINAYMAGIYGTNIAQGLTVKIDSSGHLGTVGSSKRFKDAISPIGKASEAILALKPVTFHYKKQIDPEETPQFGLVAEEVEKVNSDLVARDTDGKVYTVRYDAVNAMLLNEFLKEHGKIQELNATVARQQKQIEALSAMVRKVSEQIALSNPLHN